ncbi:SGNH/GDSL hydrolase family protein [Singulisphaera acidiphila]|uniref:SGNH hydrolase-type esterase domain-containing protein n=1 Tax=Singulisphaera acidiphila (strain ATCC BAA-1392 / DSM 18658 / VKM B-2454 / MOB10) TaxID=886293 RepID=L0DR36_SINAD|nr:hypothetical protein [Singulisphaera acidiphila]AGA31465.1 hypothetical protein Sinac_7428 [Singulisphaera acidiphila DSM 18658]
MTSNDSMMGAAQTCFVKTFAILLLGLVPLPVGWVRARSAVDSARSNEMNRTDREINAGGYYEGLIGTDAPQGGPSELTLSLIGKPKGWGRPRASDLKRSLDGDVLMFELRPNVNQMLYGEPFITNTFGMRGRSHQHQKPPETFRIAVLGSSIDMGWGVGSETMYVNELENWLNDHAMKLGIKRRFEVLNFAVPAYSPMQRFESFRRKAIEFDPDLVLYSATMLDIRLIEIHLCDMFQCRVDVTYDFLRQAVAKAGITERDIRLNADEKLRDKNAIKGKLRPHYWSIYDATMGALAAECRSAGIPLASMIIPRVGKADAPNARDENVAALRAVLTPHTTTLFDLSNTFDDLDPADLEIGPLDDHPNALGHHRLFRALARALVNDDLYETLFETPRPTDFDDHGPVGQPFRPTPPKDVGDNQP